MAASGSQYFKTLGALGLECGKLGRCAGLLALALLFPAMTHSQENEKVQRPEPRRARNVALPLRIGHEVAATGRDLVTFRDPIWSTLTLAQIGSATADGVTSVENLHSCPTCIEGGPSRIFVGQHPDAHKYVVAGIFEIGLETVTAHYFRDHSPTRKWYWKALWAVPQSVSLFEHSHATEHNLALKLD